MSGEEGTIEVRREGRGVAAGLAMCCEDGRILEECWALRKVSSCENLLEWDKYFHVNEITVTHNNALDRLCSEYTDVTVCLFACLWNSSVHLL